MSRTDGFCVAGVDHVNLETSMLDISIAFYRDVLGLLPGWRPPFETLGAWLYSGDQPVIHLVLKEDAPLATERPVNHFAFRTSGLAELKQRLIVKGVEFTETTVPDIKIVQVLFKDPNNVGIECSFTQASV